jgi:uncharacterized membrane protein
MTFVERIFATNENVHMREFMIVTLLTLFLTVTIDYIWINIVMMKEYKKMIFSVQNSPMDVRYIPTVLAYCVMIAAVVLFALPRIRKGSRLMDSLVFGGLLGFVTYGMFSFTNYALLKNWTFRVVMLDLVWGSLLFAAVTYLASFYIV